MKLYTVKEAAAELRLSSDIVYGLCKDRRLRHERHGRGRGKILIPEDALAEYRRSATVGVRREAAAPPAAAPKLRHLSLSGPRPAGGRGAG